MLFLFFFLNLIFITPGNAKVFKNSYISFEMPSRWNCELKKKAWLCRYKVSKSCQANPTTAPCKKEIKKSREAAIVMAAKEKSKIDTLKDYREHFGEIRNIKIASGSSTQSKIIHNKIVGIKNLKWVDCMHLSSELPHYYTRYLATIKGNIAVLISFTAHKKHYTNYSNLFFKSIKSLNVTTSELSKVNKNELGSQVLSRPIDIPDEFFSDMTPSEPTEGDRLSSLLFGLSMALAAAGIFIWFKKRK